VLIDFRFRNFKSFNDQQVLSLVASSDKTLSETNATASPAFGDGQLLRSCVMYGANASGKSNVVAALAFLKDLVTRSVDRQPGSGIRADPFRLDEASAQAPCEFEVSFIESGTRYQYGFSVDRQRVYDEWLTAYPNRLPQRWFSRTWNEQEQKHQFDFGSNLKGAKERLVTMTRPDALFLSIGARFNNTQLMEVFQWFSRRLQVISALDSFEGFTNYTARECNRDSTFRTGVRQLLRAADLGIADFECQKEDRDPLAVPESIPEEARAPYVSFLRALYKDEAKSIPSWSVRMQHQAAEGSIKISLPWSSESAGTQRVFSLAGPWLDTMAKGIVLVADELGSGLHPLLVKELVRIVHNSDLNRLGAQLVFNTHDAVLLDPELFRRDQIWFVEKDSGGASQLYPLTDFRPRKEEALMKGYLRGRYGAIPIMSNFDVFAPSEDHGKG
jgi:AAA15 family ATPase/GTPase